MGALKFREASEVSAKNFVKLKDGESIQGVFRGSVYEFRQHWKDNRGTLCTGSGCALCVEKKPGFRFRLNFITPEGGQQVAKIFEQGWTVYEAMRALHTEYDLETTIVKITRYGTGTDTSYSILPVKNGTLSEEQQAKLAEIPLLKLEHTATEDDVRD